MFFPWLVIDVNLLCGFLSEQKSQNFVWRLDDDDLEDEYEVDIDSNEDSKGKGSGLKVKHS
jgi:hypothetical protein